MKKHTALFSLLLLSLLAACNVDEQPEIKDIGDAVSESSNWSNTAQAPGWDQNLSGAYETALCLGLSQEQAKIFAKARQDKIAAGNSVSWSTFYAVEMALGKPEYQAFLIAEAKEAELQKNQVLGRTRMPTG